MYVKFSSTFQLNITIRNQTIVTHMFDALKSCLGDDMTKGGKVMDLLIKQIGQREGYSPDMAKEV